MFQNVFFHRMCPPVKYVCFPVIVSRSRNHGRTRTHAHTRDVPADMAQTVAQTLSTESLIDRMCSVPECVLYMGQIVALAYTIAY